ncbi:28 kDa ribonucleoprotein, chloroplastic-like [Magnolia sinica]|uniref:28 kDa ribonucleoprotein, chloroplastic-like n=1 Tax=Magnolia sinica TaxID=86752 RepID=UPI0026598D0C|nr:28 kDa ribonucleoprotein, chloroplastic-like [Magnolia sinica]
MTLQKEGNPRRWGDSSSDESGKSKGKGSTDCNRVTTQEEEVETDQNEQEWQEVRLRKPTTMASEARKQATFPTLYRKGFPKGWYPLNIERIFGRAGAVMDVVMPRDRETGRFRGFALVCMSSETELAKAVTMLHGIKFEGCPLLVQRARYGPNLSIPLKPQPTKVYRPKSTVLPPPPPPLLFQRRDRSRPLRRF